MVDVPAEAKPHAGSAHRGAEADQVVVEDEPQHASKRLRVRLVDRLQDDLAQSLLALRRQQQPLDVLPAVRARGDEQARGHVAAHRAGRMVAAHGRDQRLEHLLALRSPGVDRRGEQDA